MNYTGAQEYLQLAVSEHPLARPAILDDIADSPAHGMGLDERIGTALVRVDRRHIATDIGSFMVVATAGIVRPNIGVQGGIALNRANDDAIGAGIIEAPSLLACQKISMSRIDGDGGQHRNPFIMSAFAVAHIDQVAAQSNAATMRLPASTIESGRQFGIEYDVSRYMGTPAAFTAPERLDAFNRCVLGLSRVFSHCIAQPVGDCIPGVQKAQQFLVMAKYIGQQ